MNRHAPPPGSGLRAVVFDMDGVLIDTEPVWRRVEIEVFGSLGVHLTEADCRQTMGVRIDEVVGHWFQQRPWTGPSTAEVARMIVGGLVEHVRAMGSAMPGAVEAVRLVRRRRLRTAVASSSPLALIDAVLDALGIRDQVEVVCSAADEAHGKPAPDVYLRAAGLLELPPRACLAVEDSVFGVLSARAAGMPCAAVTDAQTAGDPRLDAASVRLSSLRDLDGARLDAIAAAYFS